MITMNLLATTSSPQPPKGYILKTIWAVDEGATYDINAKNTQKSGRYVAIRTIEGQGEIEISAGGENLSDRKITKLMGGSVFVTMTKDILSYRTRGDRWYFYWFEFDTANKVEDLLIEDICGFSQEKAIMEECFLNLKLGKGVIASSAFAYLQARWYEGVDNSGRVTELDSIITYINSMPIKENLTIEQLSERFNISTRNLHNKFIKQYNVSPKKYILDKKYEAIKLLLTTTDMKMYEIAERTGFASEYYFSKAFKKYIGMTPTEYRTTGII